MRGNKKNKRIKNRLNILRELHLNKKRVKRIKKSLTTVTLQPFRDHGRKIYKINDREDRNSDHWDNKATNDRILGSNGILNLTWEV